MIEIYIPNHKVAKRVVLGLKVFVLLTVVALVYLLFFRDSMRKLTTCSSPLQAIYQISIDNKNDSVTCQRIK